MSEHLSQDTAALARALLDVMPVVLRRIHSDVPLECGPAETTPGLREVSELRTTPGQLTLFPKCLLPISIVRCRNLQNILQWLHRR